MSAKMSKVSRTSTQEELQQESTPVSENKECTTQGGTEDIASTRPDGHCAEDREKSQEDQSPEPSITDMSVSARDKVENDGVKAKKNDSQRNSKLGKTILGAITTLKGQVEAIYDDSSEDLPTDLKDQLDELKKMGRRFAEDKKKDDDGKYVCEILRLPMDEWLKKGWNDKDPPLHVIKAYYRSVPDRTQGGTEKGGQISNSGLGSEKPLRVVINSELLIQNLEEITGIGIDYHSLVVNSPYKLFMHAWPHFKPYLSRLRAQQEELKTAAKLKTSTAVQKGDVKDPRIDSPNATNQHNGQREETTSVSKIGKKPDAETLARRIEHLELLSKFIETDLAHLLELREKIREGSLESISFEDLWHLFNPGDILFTNENGHEQLYTAYMVSGGKQRLRNVTRDEIDEIRSMQRSHKTTSKLWSRYYGISESEEDDDDRPRMDAAGKGTWTPLVVDCYRMGYDGSYVGPIDALKKISRFVGKKRITDLSIYPLRFHPKADEIAGQLEQRGRRFIQCSGHRSYDGLIFDGRGEVTKEELQGDVYIDFEEYFRSQKKWKRPKLGKLRMSQPNSAEITEQDHTASRATGDLIELMDHEIDQLRTHTFLSEKTWTRELMKTSEVLECDDILRLFPHWVVAFAFRTRTWVHLDLDSITEIDKSDNARKTGFNELVIPPKYRRLLVSLVESHTSGGNVKPTLSEPESSEQLVRQIDLVRGKGLGLIILLHGPPGSGKTSTAETIAAYTGRPLYAITCGDLGLEPDAVEKTLESHTRRADKWGCVLLLDEADVFLMKREWRDMKRNALVAVFLRQLEYYAGILFLTTNRVGVIDEAFKSRIHIALRYPKIEQRQTRKIWKNILDHLERDNETREVKIDFDREELLEYAESQFENLKESESTWNGRQIRNAFQTAIALGQYERSMRLQEKDLTSEEAVSTGKKKWRRLKLSIENFNTIADTAQEFEDYLYSVRGERDPDVALNENLRDDNYSGSAYATPMRKDNTNYTASYSRSALSPSVPQRSNPGGRLANPGMGISRVQSIKTTSLNTGHVPMEDSEDSADEEATKKRAQKKKKKSESSESESD